MDFNFEEKLPGKAPKESVIAAMQRFNDQAVIGWLEGLIDRVPSNGEVIKRLRTISLDPVSEAAESPDTTSLYYIWDNEHILQRAIVWHPAEVIVCGGVLRLDQAPQFVRAYMAQRRGFSLPGDPGYPEIEPGGFELNGD